MLMIGFQPQTRRSVRSSIVSIDIATRWVCENYRQPKNDYLYRGDVLADVPFVTYDGKRILVQNQAADVVAPWIPRWARKPKPRIGETISTIAGMTLMRGIIMTRTCEADKFSGVHNVYPAVYVAPIRPLSDFDSTNGSGIDFAANVENGFEIDGGERKECYRFAYVPKCDEHGMEAGLICFREMQPVNIRYLVAAEKTATLSIRSVHYVVERFQKFFAQRSSDDSGDVADEGDVSPTIAHYKTQNEKEATRGAPQAQKPKSENA